MGSHLMHLYDKDPDPPTEKCPYTTHSIASNATAYEEFRTKFKVWLIGNPSDSRMELYGWGEAFKTVWDHQHPRNCSNSKFMVFPGWIGGFGSYLHVFGASLGHAMDEDRVLVLEKVSLGVMFENDYCKQLGIRLDCCS
jgi:hypothetical protein